MNKRLVISLVIWYFALDFFDQGRERDNEICERMECYDEVDGTCGTVQRPLDGTPCGDSKWCKDGECVNDIDAPAGFGSEGCLYGDYKGVLDNGMKCPALVASAPWSCYEEIYSDLCCGSCGEIYRDGYDGCEYGDSSGDCEHIRPRHCYDSYIQEKCCDTCGRYHHDIKDCEYGDRKDWCPAVIRRALDCYQREADCCLTCRIHEKNIEGCKYGDRSRSCLSMPASSCYNSEMACCETCANHALENSPGCKYGDRENWCAYLPQEQCHDESNMFTCCKRCENAPIPTTTEATPTVEQSTATTHMGFPRVTPTSSVAPSTGVGPGCAGVDQATWCRTLTAHHCYKTRDTCCERCTRFFTGVPGCEFGDRVSWCYRHVINARDCYRLNNDGTCCKTCARFYTGIIGCEYGDQKSGCSLEDCNDAEERRLCCVTCRTTTPLLTSTVSSQQLAVANTSNTGLGVVVHRDPVCDVDDQADWCATLHPSHCYNSNTRITCCRKCNSLDVGPAGCEFGDRNTWCPQMTTQQCQTLTVRCCESCVP